MRKPLLIFTAIAIVFAACKSSEKSSSKTKVYNSGNAIGNYTGQLPCADCTAIDYQLSVKADGTYEEKTLYVGKSGTQNYTRGKWRMTSDTTFRLEKATPGTDQFEVGENTIWLLDMNGKRVQSEMAGKYKLQKEKGALKGAWRDMFAKGIDFMANGNEPSWFVEIDLEKNIHFKSLGDNLDITTPVPVAQAIDNTTTYSALADAGFLTIKIKKAVCKDAMSGEESPYTVTVDYNGKTYNGCGRYFYDERLNDLWVLKTYKDGKVPEAKNFTKGIPTIEFKIKDKKAMGIAGCNSFTGTVDIRGSRLDFGPIASTKMMCKSMDVENAYLAMLKSDVRYEIKNGELYLYDEKEKAWVFRKQ